MSLPISTAGVVNSGPNLVLNRLLSSDGGEDCPRGDQHMDGMTKPARDIGNALGHMGCVRTAEEQKTADTRHEMDRLLSRNRVCFGILGHATSSCRSSSRP